MWSSCGFMVLAFILQCTSGLDNNLTGCFSEASCLKCGPTGCIKCLEKILYPTRKCVVSCPFGFKPRWSTRSDYMGEVCVHSRFLIGLSADIASVLTGILCGTIFCCIIIATAVAYVRNKRKYATQTSETNSDLDDSPEMRDFVKQLEILRPYSHTFLDMLNDSRRQLRELHQQGDNTAASVYKPVVRDLAKILLLLNRPIDRLGMPDDWEHLFRWAEKALKRYKRMSAVSQAQVAQLIDFLQSPVSTEPDLENSRASTTMSTFKPEQNFGSVLGLKEPTVGTFSTFEPALNPQWQFNFPLSTSEFIPSTQWKNSKEYLNSPYFLDDDFFQFGLRPQDEITTEL